MRLIPIDQQTRDWHRWRGAGVGASDAAAILGRQKKGFTDRATLLLEKTGQAERKSSTFQMRRGNRLEAVARKRYCDHTGFNPKPKCAEHDQFAWIRASFDGVDIDRRICLEIKCPDFNDHEFALNGMVPLHYRPQLCHLALVTGYDVIHYWSFNDGRKRFPHKDQHCRLVAYKPTPADLAELLDAERRFWRDVCEIRRRQGIARQPCPA